MSSYRLNEMNELARSDDDDDVNDNVGKPGHDNRGNPGSVDDKSKRRSKEPVPTNSPKPVVESVSITHSRKSVCERGCDEDSLSHIRDSVLTCTHAQFRFYFVPTLPSRPT